MLRFLLALVLVHLASTTSAQEPTVQFSSQILIIDQEALFQRSQFAQSLLGELEEESKALAAENREIEEQLIAEEKQLTEERESLEPEVFRQKAMAFDEKVVALRASQDEKTRQLLAKRETLQQSFYQAALPVLTEIIRERGALVVLDTRSVFLSSGQVDITNEAITRIDAAFVNASETPSVPE